MPNPTSITNGVTDRWYLRTKWPSDPDTKGRVLVIYQPTLYTLTPFRVNKGVKDVGDLTGGESKLLPGTSLRWWIREPSDFSQFSEAAPNMLNKEP